MKTYTLVDYIDVWGNSEDGYTVNDAMRYENYVDISENSSENDIIQALVNKGYLLANVKYDIIASDENYMEIWVDDYPICALTSE